MSQKTQYILIIYKPPRQTGEPAYRIFSTQAKADEFITKTLRHLYVWRQRTVYLDKLEIA